MKKFLMVLLLTTLFQGFAMANDVEHQTLAEKYGYDKLTTEELIRKKAELTEKLIISTRELIINTIEETTTLSRTEILKFFYIYNKFGYKATYEAYCILYDVTLEDWEIDLLIEECGIAGIAAGLYTLERLSGRILSKQ